MPEHYDDEDKQSYDDPDKPEPMSEQELSTLIGQRINAAMNREDGDLSDVREALYAQYFGGAYGHERDGHSSFVSREILEAVEWAKPTLIRMYTSGDKVVTFEPVNVEDEEAAAQETDIVNYRVSRANGGDSFVAISELITDALLNPTAYAKVWMEEKTVRTIGESRGLSAEQLAKLDEEEGVDILEHRSYTIKVPVPMIPGMEMLPLPMRQQEIEVFDVKHRRIETKQTHKLVGVPAEEVLIDADLHSVNLDDANFVCHRSRQSFTNLVNQGYDREMLEKVGSSQDEVTWNEERVNRNFYEDESPGRTNDSGLGGDDSMRMYWVHECYLWVDFDGDGVGEYRRVVRIGDDIFENEETNYQPLVAMSTILVPHKHNGLSLAQLVQDLQLLLTELTREMIDNVRAINVRRKFMDVNAMVPDGATLMASLNPAATIIPVQTDPTRAIMPDPATPVMGDLLPLIQDMRNATSLRTGIAPENAIDKNVLQQSTYGAFMGAMERANERLELIARVMGETGIKQIYRKFHQLQRMFPDIATTVKLRNKWVEVDPEGWRDRTDVSVNTGLGFSNKQQQMQATMQAIELQKGLFEMGLVTEKEIYNAHAKFVEVSGLGSPDFLFKNPSDPGWQPPQPKPNPEAERLMAEAQALTIGAQTNQDKVQADAQIDMTKAQTDQFKAQATAQKDQAAHQARMRELDIKDEERESRARLNQVEAIKTVAETENTETDTELKEAQTAKAFADAAAAARKPAPKETA